MTDQERVLVYQERSSIWERQCHSAAVKVQELTERVKELEDIRVAAISFVNEAPQSGDYALLLCSLTANVSEQQRDMVEVYGRKREALVKLIREQTIEAALTTEANR